MSTTFEPLAACLHTHLPAFLARQRWFAGKGRVIEALELEDVIEIDARPPCALAIVEVRYVDTHVERYVLLFAVTNDADPALRIAAADEWDGAADLIEAATLETQGRALLAGFTRAGTRLRSRAGATLVYGDMRDTLPLGAQADTVRVKPLGAEQSNTSLRAGEDHVFKLFRRLEDGENPEVEIGRFFAAHTSFDALPVLDGSLALERDGGTRTVGVLQRFVKHRADGWRWMLAQLASWRAGDLTVEALAGEARRIGGLTADMHLALGSCRDVPAFAPRPIVERDVETWRVALETRAERLVADMRREHQAVPPGAKRDAAEIAGSVEALPALAPTAAEAGAAGVELIRLHGDYHLGQTLRTDDGYVVMDFEGEPSRPLAERRAHGCALRDVAGMLRSFDYAAAAGPGAADPGHTADPARAALRDAFLAAYLERVAAQGAAFVPAREAIARRWIAFFELDKALYEIEYELHHRPDWIWIPLRGARQLIEANLT